MGRRLGDTPPALVAALEKVYLVRRDLRAAEDRLAAVLGTHLRERIEAMDDDVGEVT